MLGQLLEPALQVVEVLGGGDSVKHTLPKIPQTGQSHLCRQHLKLLVAPGY